MDRLSGEAREGGTGRWPALALCAAVLAAGIVEAFVRDRFTLAGAFRPVWVPLAAVVLTAAAITRPDGGREWARTGAALLWCAFLLMIWAANGLPFDLLRLTPLIPLPVDWPGLPRRALALAAAVVLAWPALPRSATTRPATWYGYAAFALALPYPLLRTLWALGSTLGLTSPGAAGPPEAWLMAIPWLLAAALSLLLVPTWRWLPRRLLLVAGWFATTMVALVGPAACWALLSRWLSGTPDGRIPGMAMWVPALFYASWLLWAIAAGAATRSYQLRSAARRVTWRVAA